MSVFIGFSNSRSISEKKLRHKTSTFWALHKLRNALRVMVVVVRGPWGGGIIKTLPIGHDVDDKGVSQKGIECSNFSKSLT